MLPCSESMAHPCSSARHTGVTTRMHSRRNALICGTSPAAAPTRRGTGSRQEGASLRAALPSRTVAAPASTGAFATPSRARSSAGSARDAAVVVFHAAAGQLPGRGGLQRCHAQPASSLGLFPAGSAALTVKLPALFLCVDADSVLQDPDTLPSISQAVAAGATAVLLSESPASGASALYDAACALRGTLRGRASLLLMDRTDIATAAEADGVVLTEQGVPTVVAKRMMQRPGGGSALVGRIVTSAQAAVTAAADGASLLLVSDLSGGPASAEVLQAARTQQRSGNAIPVLQHFTSPSTTPRVLAAAWPEGLAGVSGPLGCLRGVLAPAAQGGERPLGADDTITGATQAILERLLGVPAAPTASSSSSSSSSSAAAGPLVAVAAAADAPTPAPAAATVIPAAPRPTPTPSRPDPATNAPGAVPSSRSWIRRLLNMDREALLADEKAALGTVLGFLEDVVPTLPELQLLRDALKQLEDLFLVVVVGEFNSGKSSVINALLGNNYLAEGILPTTNEISILRYDDSESQEGRLEQRTDGMYVRYLPAPLLREVNIVDTPGTNVILDRQQRLTEEYVPRADLVLFVMSADRPFSESEVKFLEYIRQWKKKVVFVVNKVDLLRSAAEVDEVQRFVSSNAQRLLKLDNPSVMAVSSRAALRAKLNTAAALGSVTGSFEEASLLSEQPDWTSSGFGPFERFIYNFLIGGIDGRAGEGVRLKLQTPLYVADALMGACGRLLAADIDAASAELKAVRLVQAQLRRFREEMEKDAAAQREALNRIQMDANAGFERFIDRTIQLSNLNLILGYVAGTPGASAPTLASFEAEVVAAPLASLKGAVTEHGRWLTANCASQLEYYSAFVAQRRAAAAAAGAGAWGAGAAGLNGASSASAFSTAGTSTSQGAAASPSPAASPASPAMSSSLANTTTAAAPPAPAQPGAPASSALAVLSDLKPAAASVVLDEEIRQAFVGTAGVAVGGPLAGMLVAGVTPNALEDLLFLTVGGLASYASVLNLPLRRAEIKKRAGKAASDLVGQLQERMRADLDQQLAVMMAEVQAQVAPLEAACEAELQRLQGLEERRRELTGVLAELQKQAANVE